MTRINTIEVELLTDQHLMAEYRELPMVLASARRSNPSLYVPSTQYTLNAGHVKFFWNKRQYLQNRWNELIAELYCRDFNINPNDRRVSWDALEPFDQVDWQPSREDKQINIERLLDRILEKPEWYRYYGTPIV